MEDIIFDEYDEYEVQKKVEVKTRKRHHYSTGFRKCALALVLAVAISTGFSTVPGRVDNMVTVEAARKKDKKKPVIKLSGKSNIRVTQNESVKIPKATAKDNVDGNITKKIKVSVKCGKKSYAALAKKIQKNKAVTFTKIGKYVITYTVSDKAKNKATKKRTITVIAKAEEGKTTEAVTTRPTTEKVTTAATTESKMTTEQVTTAATTEAPKKIVLTNTEGKDAGDVAALKKIITEQNSKGACIKTDLDSNAYTWDNTGRLIGLYWHKTGITGSLEMSEFTALLNLSCGNNQLMALDISKNIALKDLSCDYSQLTALDVSKNTALTNLFCVGNQLTELDVSNNTVLTDLNCGGNQLAELDVSKNTALTDLKCWENQLTKLDLSKNAALTKVGCWKNQLAGLDLSKNTILTEVVCYNNQLTVLDVSKNAALAELKCQNNQLTELDVSNNIALTGLYCRNNQLTELDVSKNTALTYLSCVMNELTELDVSKNTNLTELYYDIYYVTVTGWPK